MDRLKRFALKNVASGLDKVLEAKAHFDKREDKKSYTKKIIRLKETLTDIMLHGEEKQRPDAYYNIQMLSRIQSEHELMTDHKRKIDELWKQYGEKD